MTEHAFEPMRRAMVASQLRTTGVNDPRVIAAMGEVARERFVPEDRKAIAYADALVPIGDGRQLNPPMALGRMLTEAKLRGPERALVIGAGAGYAAAVLARLVASVTALEESGDLAATARTALAGTGVEIVEGPLNQGHAAGAPYDFILIDGAVEAVPQAIVDQVADGGEIALALIDQGVTRLGIGRVVAGAFGVTTYADAAAAALPGFEKPRTFSF
ncbi:methyltransferase domain-containing protein [Sphingosinicella sp. LHD-64]|uniref:protein-L-isoaspartate O-methyltransferase family protein n=1 Tax=Sphingosinicella sp. LHD-64 TaxID=3072139 RepID=UPI00280E0695|nr:methyltransferase domain-containing protein [Sphingosinicella sp. LHD-64]MDQ8754882.1 methyltransferase domain-containing protein [Sphingosinicella sp. LHD-64]